MRTSRRLTVTLAALAVAWAGLAAPAVLAGPGESSFLAKMNAERSGRGLGSLEMYWDLVDDARAHSQRMADEGNLRHNPSLGSVTGGWITLGENVGVGPSVDALHAAFMDSTGHRANILGDFNYVGVGVVQESETKLWVTVVFMKGPEGLVTPPADPPVEEPPLEPPQEDPAPPPPAEDPPPAEQPATEPPPVTPPAPTAPSADPPAEQPAPTGAPSASDTAAVEEFAPRGLSGLVPIAI